MTAIPNRYLKTSPIKQVQIHKTFNTQSQRDVEQQRTISSALPSKIRIQRSKSKKEDSDSKSQYSEQSLSRKYQRASLYNCPMNDKQLKQIAGQNNMERKRSPTPCKSMRKNGSYNKKIQQNQHYIVNKVQKDSLIYSLQKQLQQSKSSQVNLRKQLVISQQKHKSTLLVLKQSELIREKLELKNKQLETVNTSLQKNILESQLNLNSAYNNIQKLQKSVKANQIATLKGKIETLEEQNKIIEKDKNKISTMLKQKQSEINSIQSDYKQLQSKYKQLQNSTKSSVYRQQHLQREIQHLKYRLNPITDSKISTRTNQSSIASIPSPLIKSKNRHMGQYTKKCICHQDQIIMQLLQEHLNQKQQQMKRYKHCYEKLTIQLNCLQRKNLQEQRIYMSKKQQVISSFRKRLSKATNQLDSYKAKFGRHQSDNNLFNKYNKPSQSRLKNNSNDKHLKNRTIRQSIIMSDHQRQSNKHKYQDLEITLDLSPE